MTTNTALNADTVVRPIGGVPFGNLSVLPFTAAFLEGVFTLSDDATATVHTDKLILGTIPAGTTIVDATLQATAALGAATSTLDVGFEYVDGVDVAAVPEAIDQFFDAQANTAAFFARFAIGGNGPITIPKDAYLIVTVNTAAFLTTGDLAGDININLFGICDQE